MALKKIGEFKVGDENVEIRSDVKKIERQIKKFGGSLRNAQARAINRSVTKGKTLAKRLIVDEYNVKAGPIGKSLKVSPRANAKYLNAAIMARSTRLPIYNHTKNKPKQTANGARFNSGSGMKVHPHTFIAKMRSGHIGIFVRKTKRRTNKRYNVSPTTGRRYRTHLPIRELSYPSVARMLLHEEVAPTVFNLFKQDYPTQLHKQLDYELQKAKGLT